MNHRRPLSRLNSKPKLKTRESLPSSYSSPKLSRLQQCFRDARSKSLPPPGVSDRVVQTSAIHSCNSVHFGYGQFRSQVTSSCTSTYTAIPRTSEKQKWEINPKGRVKLCCTTIPFRFRRRENGMQTIEILLITSRRKHDWVLPHGGWDADETRYQCAMRETLEEAGAEGSIIATFGSYMRSSPKGYNTRTHIFIMNITNLRECWSEMKFRKRKWVDLGMLVRNLDSVFKRQFILNTWRRLIQCANTNRPESRSTVQNIYDAFCQMWQLFEIRHVPLALVPRGAKTPVPWHDHALIQHWLDNHFPIATTVRGQPNVSAKTVHYKRPWSYFVVQRDGKIIEYIDRIRPVERARGQLLSLLRRQAMRSHRRTFREIMFKFLWVLTIHGELLVTEEYTRSHEDRYTNHGDLVPASLSDYASKNASKNEEKSYNIVQNVDIQGKYRGIARMGGELVVSARSHTWLMNNISGFSLARITPQCRQIPSKRALQTSDAYIQNLKYKSLVVLREYLGRFIRNMDQVILLSGDIAGQNLKDGLNLRVRNESGICQVKRCKISMADLLEVYFKRFLSLRGRSVVATRSRLRLVLN